MTEASSLAKPVTGRALFALACVATLVRGGVLLASKGELSADPDAYRAIASNLATHGTFASRVAADGSSIPTAYRPPLYPLVLAPWIALGWAELAIAGLNLVLGTATVVLTAILASRMGLERNGAVLAGMLVAVDPLLLRNSAMPMTETLAAFLAVVVLLAMNRAASRPNILRGAAAGAAFALAALCRPVFLPAAVASGLLLVFVADAGMKNRWKTAAGFFAALIVVLAPWGARNYVQIGKPIVATTHGGYTLHLANNPSFYKHLRTADWGAVWIRGPEDLSIEVPDSKEGKRRRSRSPELASDEAHYRAAWKAIAEEPASFAWSCLARVGHLWRLVPKQLAPEESAPGRLARWSVGIYYGVVFLLAIAGIVSLGGRVLRPPWLWPLVLAASFTLVHAFYWTDMRMRAPLGPAVALAAALAASRLSRAKAVAITLDRQKG